MINIDGKSFDINIHLSNNENKVVYVENKKVKIIPKVVDGVLMISEEDNRKFHDKLISWGNLEVDLYLSQTTINSLNIVAGTTDVDIEQGFEFTNVNITNSTGNIEFKSNVNPV